jgi:DNA-binding transcriptional MerR regulator
MDKEIPNKLFFKIGEVCEITDTQPYVLRYWESEFPALAPAKNSSGQRIYRRRDIETVLRIKQLLYEEGFTIAGAKKRLEAEMSGRTPTPQHTPSSAAAHAPAPAPTPAPLASRTPTPSSMAANAQAIAATPTPAPPDDHGRAIMVEVREQLREILTLLNRSDKKA